MLKTIFAFWMLTAVAGRAWAAGTPCGDLTKLKLPHLEISSATLVDKGTFTPPAEGGPGGPPGGPGGAGGGQGGPAPSGAAVANSIYATLPSFCRVQATSRPTPDSDIKIEVWMPADGWNSRLEAIGNGAFGSNIMLNQLAQGVAKGYVATGNNTGHEGNTGAFAIGHPEKLIDWGYRAVHEGVVAAKAISAAFYGSGPKYSYWNSCSTGGRQGWVAAEYYPEDFDGLAIGDPANPMTRLQASSIVANLAVNKDEASFITPPKWAAIHQWALRECDAKDGLKDGLIENPMACNLDMKQLACKDGADADDCLTPPQLTALAQVVGGAKDPGTGVQLYPGYPLGIEMGRPIAGKQPDPAGPYTFQALYQDPNWDYHSMNLAVDIPRSDKLGNHLINAVDPAKLQQVFAHGGKILLYHGWNDPAIPAPISIQLYEQAVAANGGKDKTYNDIRLFMVPGMNHCGGGEGPNMFDKLDVISDWVEHGKAPDSIVAAHATNGQTDRTRPLCPYPQIAKYKGAGSIDEAQNFVCAAQ